MATDFYTNAFADNFRLAKSRIIVSPATATFNVIRVPKYAFVSDVWLQVVIATNVEPDNCSVGWSGNADTAVTNGFITIETADPRTTGLKRAQKDTLTTFQGKYFSGGSGVITFTFDDGAATTLGSYIVFAQYTVVH
jgi:hypothetical protein